MAEKYFGYFVTEDEYNQCIKTKKQFVSGTPHRYDLVIEPIEHLSATNLRAHILIKHPSLYSLAESDWTYLNSSDFRNFVPLKNYLEKRERFYITSDRVTFHVISDILTNTEMRLEFSLLHSEFVTTSFGTV